MAIQMRRVYEPPAPDDGYRVLIDRVWPRGVSKEEARLDGWLKELAVSTELRRWFGHDPARWAAFRERYRDELRAPERRGCLQELAERARAGPVTIVYGARDTEHNNAVVLAEVLTEALASSRARERAPLPRGWRRHREHTAGLGTADTALAHLFAAEELLNERQGKLAGCRVVGNDGPQWTRVPFQPEGAILLAHLGQTAKVA